MAKGMNWGIFSLLAVVVVVLGGFAAFFVFLARRAASFAAIPAAAPLRDSTSASWPYQRSAHGLGRSDVRKRWSTGTFQPAGRVGPCSATKASALRPSRLRGWQPQVGPGIQPTRAYDGKAVRIAARRVGAGRHVDTLIIYMHWLMIALFVGWLGYFGYVLVRFRRARNPRADYRGVTEPRFELP